MTLSKNKLDIKAFKNADENTIFTDGDGNFGCKVHLSEHILFDEKDGFLYCNDVVLGNVGVQYYKGYELKFADSKATIEVHREEADVFDEISLDSLKGKPVTLRHPSRLLDSETATDHVRGAIYGNPRRDGDNIVADLVIYDRELIDLVAPEDENGERKLSKDFRDLSLGYRSKLVRIGDKPNTYKQTNIRYNHVAVLEAGRQINAMIRDSANEELEKEGKSFMGVFARLKGKSVKRNEETKEVTILDEDVEIEVDIEDASRILSEYQNHSIDKHEKYDDPTKVIVTETVSKTITTEEDKEFAHRDGKTEEEVKEKQDLENKEEETNQEKEIKDMDVKDKVYFQKALREAMSLPEGAIRNSAIEDLNKEFADAFPVKEVEVNDTANPKVNPVNIDKELEKQFKDSEKPTTDYEAYEAESRDYYRKLTDPFAHNSWKEFNDHFNQEVRKGRVLIS